jgi:hypothetical protein
MRRASFEAASSIFEGMLNGSIEEFVNCLDGSKQLASSS